MAISRVLRPVAAVCGVCLSMTFASGPGAAAVPPRLLLQGYLTDLAGQPRTGAFQMEFRLFDAAEEGTLLWEEAHTALAVEGGLYVAELGSLAPFPPDLFSGATLWLETAVNDTTLSPRRPMLSVAHALRAAVADSAGVADRAGHAAIADSAERSALGNSVESGEVADETLTDADVAPGAAISGTKIAPDFGAQEVRTLGDLRGAAARVSGFEMPPGAVAGRVLTTDGSGHGTWQPVPVTGVGGGGTPGAIPVFTSSTTLGNSVITESGGSVGIGTPSPAARLHTAGLTPAAPAWIAQGAPGQSAPLAEFRTSAGAVVAAVGASGIFSGNGSGLMALDAGALTTGTLPSGRLSGTYNNPLNLSHPGNALAGNGASINSLNASALTTGILPSDRLSGGYSNPVGFTNPSNSFTGNGSGLTGLNASSISSGTLNIGALPTGGTWALSGFLATTGPTGYLLYHDGGNGRLGIGTTAPQSRLHVAPLNGGQKGIIVQGVSGQGVNLEEWQSSTGAVLASMSPGGMCSAVSFSGNGSALTGLSAYNISSGTLAASQLPVGGTWSLGSGLGIDSGTLYVDPANNRVGIGTTSPTKILTITPSETDYDITTSGPHGLDVTTQGGTGGAITISARESSSGGIVITTSNNVGIGTVTPGDKLTVNGTFSATGAKNAIVPTGRGLTRLYSEESSEVWFSDYGTARLRDGHVRVDLDPLFLETVTITDEQPLKVFAQLRDDCNGVYVRSDARGFDLFELRGGQSGAAIDYRVVAKRRGYERDRLESAPPLAGR